MATAESRKVYNLSLQFARSKGAKQKLADRIKEQVVRGDVYTITASPHTAHERGLLIGKENILAFLRTITANLTKNPKGKRYDVFTKSLFEVAKIWDGWRMVMKLLSGNLGDPAQSRES